MAQHDRYSLLQYSLIEIRHARGLTQVEVANRLNKPQSYVSKYESGERRLDVVEFLDICDALETNPMSILGKLGGN